MFVFAKAKWADLRRELKRIDWSSAIVANDADGSAERGAQLDLLRKASRRADVQRRGV